MSERDARGRPIRVLHCDDYEPFIALVEVWLSEHGDVEHVGAARDREAALKAVGALQPDVVLLDTMVRGQDRLTVGEIRAACPTARVVVYSGYPPEVAESMVDDGADAYVEKADDDMALVDAIRRISGRA